MGNGSVADTMMDAMVVNAGSKHIAGNYALAAEDATKYINTIEGRTTEVRETFGPVLLKLYCIRAQSRYMLGKASNDQTVLQEANRDIEKALVSVDNAYKKLGPNDLARLKESVQNIIHPDADVRKANFKTVVEAATEGNAVSNKYIPRVMFFLIGVAVWTVLLTLVSLVGKNAPTSVLFVIGVVLIGAVFLAIQGWDWYSNYKFGSYGSLIKYMVVIFIGCTGIGLLPIAYWTGKGLVRGIAKIRGLS